MEIDPDTKKHATLTISIAHKGTTVFCQLCATMCAKHILMKLGKKSIHIF